MPPAARIATVSGSTETITAALGLLELPSYVEVLGPTQTADDQVRLVLRTDRHRGAGMTTALQRLQAVISSRKLAPVSVHVDPSDFA